MRYQVINIHSQKVVFESNDLAEAKLALTNTSRVLIDTDDIIKTEFQQLVELIERHCEPVTASRIMKELERQAQDDGPEDFELDYLYYGDA